MLPLSVMPPVRQTGSARRRDTQLSTRSGEFTSALSCRSIHTASVLVDGLAGRGWGLRMLGSAGSAQLYGSLPEVGY